jgi:pimeloyl-ACP methyl ester carboxylesterase
MSKSNPGFIDPAARPTVVLLHCSASSARQWEPLVETLQPRYRVRTVDFHGHGERPAWRTDAPLTLTDEAALVAPLLAAAGGAHVIGHSYGAAVALKVATMHPGLVRSLVVHEPVLFRWLIDDDAGRRSAPGVVAVAAAIRGCLAMNQKQSAAQRFIDFWCGVGAWDSMPGRKQDSVATHMRAVLQQFEALFREPLQRAQLARLGVPMLFMTGALTVTAMRRLADLLLLALPRARHELLQDMGHMGPITHAAQVNRRIVEFLHAQDRSASALGPLGECAHRTTLALRAPAFALGATPRAHWTTFALRAPVFALGTARRAHALASVPVGRARRRRSLAGCGVD